MAHSLNEWMKRAEVDTGKRAGIPTEMADCMKALKRENRGLRQGEEGQKTVRCTVVPTNEILPKGEPVKATPVQAHWRTRILR